MSKALEIAEIGNSLSVDGNGNLVFEAGVGITADVTGNADTATTLETARTINGVSFNGSANITVTATATNALTIGSYLTGSSYNGSSAITIAADATSANTGSKLVARDASGNFSAGAITASGLTIGAITLPATDGTNGQVLTTNGSGAVTFADAGGSALELYVENPVSPTAPSATGNNAVAIGSGAIASDHNAVAIGLTAIASQDRAVALGFSLAAGMDAVAIGIGATNLSYGARATGAVAIGSQASATALQACAVGTNATASGSRSNAFGHETDATNTESNAFGSQAQSTGVQSTAISRAYASGADSFAAAIGNNTSTYGATGANSIAMGYQAKATQANGIAIGDRVVATGNPSIAVGRQITASGAGSAAFGINYSGNNIASGENSLIVTRGGVTASGKNSAIFGGYSKATAERSFALGTNAASDSYGKFAFSAKGFNQDFYVDGSAQAGLSILSRITTDATSAYLSGSTGSTSTNQIILPNNSAYAFSGMIVARQDPATGTACAAWKVEGLIRREANAASTVLVNSALTVLDNTPAWDITLTADTTVGALKITATGAAATTIRWVATINTAEVNFLN